MTSQPARALKRESQPDAAKQEPECKSGVRYISPLATAKPTLIDTLKSTGEAIVQLRLRKIDAERFLSDCDSRSNKKRLGKGYFAECTKANTVICLIDVLDTMFQKAEGREDLPALLNIGIAARMLAVKIQRDALLRMETYPEGDAGRAVAESMISNVQNLYQTIKTMLGSFPESLGVEFPSV